VKNWVSILLYLLRIPNLLMISNNYYLKQYIKYSNIAFILDIKKLYFIQNTRNNYYHGFYIDNKNTSIIKISHDLKSIESI
jgi:hypothetical protein